MKTLQELDTWLGEQSAARKPLTFTLMSQQERDDFYSAFGKGSFSDEQRAVLRKYWLVIPTPNIVETINEALPAHVRVSPVTTIGGDTVCNIDLLTDAETYGGAASVLRTLKVKQLDPSTDFPQDEIV